MLRQQVTFRVAPWASMQVPRPEDEYALACRPVTARLKDGSLFTFSDAFEAEKNLHLIGEPRQ